MALQLEKAIGRRVMIHGLPITMILCYCIKTATQPFSTLPVPAPCIPFPHWLLRLLSILKVTSQILLPVQLGSFLPTGIPSLQSRGGEGGGGAGPLGNILLETR